MADDERMRQIAELEAEIAQLHRAITKNESPKGQALLREILAKREAKLAQLRAATPSAPPVAGPTITGPVSAARDVNLATNQTIIYAQAEQRRRLDDYLALLLQLAEGERARALAAPTPPLTDGLPLDALRLAMARAALEWELPPPGEDLDEPLRRSLVAQLLLPLVLTPLLGLTPRSEQALSRLASPEICALVRREGLTYTVTATYTREAAGVAHLALLRALADPQYAAGCARLLADLAESPAGRDALAVAYAAYRRDGPERPVPPVIPLLAAGALGGAVGAGLLAAALALLRSGAGDERPASPAGDPPASGGPSPAPTGGTWQIPVALAEWRAELARRNETFGAPAGYWCSVRPGTYRIGGWERGAPAADLELPGFWVARVPVTVAQYATFLEAGGYRDSRWWTPQGVTWLRDRKVNQPYRWREAPHNSRPRQAVTGIRWYEALAFCAWLSAQLGQALPYGYALRLPSEAEWEAAAAYDRSGRRRTYPWGEEPPSARRADFGRKWEEGAPDVATCPAGVAACGALDLAGTAWEWTAGSHAAYPQRAHWLREDAPTDTADIPQRGGSYGSIETYVRCGARIWVIPHGRNTYDSLRVVLAPRLAR